MCSLNSVLLNTNQFLYLPIWNYKKNIDLKKCYKKNAGVTVITKIIILIMIMKKIYDRILIFDKLKYWSWESAWILCVDSTLNVELVWWTVVIKEKNTNTKISRY